MLRIAACVTIVLAINISFHLVVDKDQELAQKLFAANVGVSWLLAALLFSKVITHVINPSPGLAYRVRSFFMVFVEMIVIGLVSNTIIATLWLRNPRGNLGRMRDFQTQYFQRMVELIILAFVIYIIVVFVIPSLFAFQ